MSLLKEMREARGLSQPVLARLARTSQQQIDRLEKGQRRLTLPWARRLASLLGVDAHELQPVDAYGTASVVGYVGVGEEVFFFSTGTRAQHSRTSSPRPASMTRSRCAC